MDFYQGSDLEQKTTNNGEKCYNTSFSKMSEHLSVKSVKTQKTKRKSHNMKII